MSMTKRSFLLFAALVLAAAPASAQPALRIDFEHYPGPDGALGTVDDVPTPVPAASGPAEALGSQYSSVGVTFTTGTLFAGALFPSTAATNHFISSTNPSVTLSVPAYGIAIDSYSVWTAVLSAYDSANNLIATNTLVHPNPAGPFLSGTLRVWTSQPIARFTVLPLGCATAQGCSEILNLDNLRLVLIATPPSVDADGDGLSDAWEVYYGLDPASSIGQNGAAGDPDGDARTNLQEFTAGTNPTFPATLTLEKTALQFGATTNGTTFVAKTPAQTVRLAQSGTGSLVWTATSNQPWLQVSPAAGIGPATLSVSVVPGAGALNPGLLTGAITVALAGPGNPLGSINVALRLKATGTSTAPFGLVDTPLENTTGATGSVPFTGWALDDVEVTGVTICRAAVANDIEPVDPNCGGNTQIFLGTAVFIDGARPDVQTAFPGVPLNSRGGWGFMVLTNTLPNVGNGTFEFFFYARDLEGQGVLLGTRTMTCDNAHATLPFGAIDTPTQGGLEKDVFVNFGWALTQAGKFIPFDGSTIGVMVDGVRIGTVDYNHFRPDVAARFPGLANSNGAVGFHILDTTPYVNGLHTISWTVTDNTGVTEGIGSRFFTIANTAPAVTATASASSRGSAGTRVATIDAAPRDTRLVLGRRGWADGAPWQAYAVGRAGRAVIRGEEIDRFELWLGAQPGESYTGYLRVGNELAALPAGSQLDAESGWFTWAPGVGFVGTYDLVFVRWAGARALARHEVRVILAPKGRGHVGAQVAIDQPRGVQSVEQPFVLAGWAADLDAAAGTGIDTLHVWAYPATGGAPVFLGTPALGGSRPDVAAVHGEEFGNAGFSLTVQGVVHGDYDLAVFPWSNVIGGFAPAKVVRVRIE